MEFDSRALQKEIDVYLRTYAIAYCKKASQELCKMAKYAIQRFYNDYTPDYYDRTFDLLRNSYSPYYHDNGKAIYGGVRIHSENMKPYKGAGLSEFQIASRTWLQGHHGFRGTDPYEAIHTYPPVALVQMEMGNKKFLNDLNKYAEKEALKKEYAILQF